MRIEIEIRDNSTIDRIVSQFPNLEEIQESSADIEIELIYSCGKFLRGEIFALLVSYERYLTGLGKTVRVIYEPDDECDTIKYASRINFFNLLGIPFDESFRRKDSSGRFMEITEFTDENLFEIVTEIVKMFKYNLKLPEKLIDALNFCFGEVVDNIDTHSESKMGGIVYAQYFEKNDWLKLFIIDNGIGFHASITQSDDFKNVSTTECLSLCCAKGVTDGKGKGMGLYFTKQFVNANRGNLILNSCGSRLKITPTVELHTECPHWQGSIIEIGISTKEDVVYENLFDGYCPYPFEESENDINESISELW